MEKTLLERMLIALGSFTLFALILSVPLALINIMGDPENMIANLITYGATSAIYWYIMIKKLKKLGWI